MALKFNPFTGTFDYTVSAEVEEKAKGIPTGGETSAVLTKKSATNYEDEWALIKNASIASAAAIEESKLSLPEVIKKLTVQTVEAEKKFETPQPAENAGGEALGSAIPIVIKSGKGGNTSIPTTGKGGTTGKVNIETGAAGEAPNAVTSSTGGTSGTINFATGPGGPAKVAGAKDQGGSTGSVSFTTGTAGTANAESTVSNVGGNAGSFKATGGGGGAGENSLKTNTGGQGGNAEFVAGVGGKGTGGEKATGGEGGHVVFTSGAGGTASGGSVTNVNGSGGFMRFVLGAGGGTEEEAKSAPFEVNYKTGGGIVRFYIHPEGNVAIGNTKTPEAKLHVLGAAKLEKGLGVWNHAPPAAQPASVKTAGTLVAFEEAVDKVLKEYGITL